MNEVRSPITGGKTEKTGRLSISEIKDLYAKAYGFDLSRIFKSLNEVLIFKCNDTGYEFFFPLDISGDEKFYSELSKADWYYDKERWEFGEALDHVTAQSKVLEIGAGSGAFLDLLKSKKNVHADALEMNLSAIKTLKEKGFFVSEETIEQFSMQNKSKYDVVCFFQVLEHISEVRSFLNSAIDVLKPGGKLLVAVPNNESFINIRENLHDDSRLLNMPPHHMGLWTEASLRSLENHFPVKLTSVQKEKFNEKNLDIYLWSSLQRKLKSLFLVRVIWKLKLHHVIKGVTRKKIISGQPGVSILAVYEKQ